MIFKIRNRLNNKVIYSCKAKNLKEAVEKAVRKKVNLDYANLSYADLRYANLSYADLSYADLSYANLSYADLSYANISSADLRFASLRYTNLIMFQYQKHKAFYTFDGSLRIGCLCLPITYWYKNYKEIGSNKNYTKEEIKMYGSFIESCYKKFLKDTKTR